MVDSFVNRKHGTELASYAHPVMEEILHETHGVMVYQEQIMRILNRLGGIELSSAYACIKAISKKKHDIIDQRKGTCMAQAFRFPGRISIRMYPSPSLSLTDCSPGPWTRSPTPSLTLSSSLQILFQPHHIEPLVKLEPCVMEAPAFDKPVLFMEREAGGVP